MKFIFADCLDCVDPLYDFLADESPRGRKPYWDDLFPHEYMDHPPYEGILVSRAIVGDASFPGKYTESQSMRFRREGARAFLRYPEKQFPGSHVMGDCGAFQYSHMPEPPYTPEEMIEFYQDGKFTHGCSVDHIIFLFDPSLDDQGLFGTMVPDEAKKRYEITLANAEKFLHLARGLGKSFTPIGVVQGWSPKSMARAAQALVGMGYDYIAIGGLVPLRVEAVHRAVAAVRDAVPRATRLHLLGFAKADVLDQFVKYGIYSFDTTSPLIRAFKDKVKNYYLPNGNGGIEYFIAIRIPQASENRDVLKGIKTGRLVQEELTRLEAVALSSLRRYSQKKEALETALEAIVNYAQMALFEGTPTAQTPATERAISWLRKEYRRTLEARPWERCTCRACRDCGVEVIIYRSNNRNRRRGFHNLEVFHKHHMALRGSVDV